MNNYIDYYNYMDNLNQTNFNIVSNDNKDYMTNPYLSFIRGNLFNNLYTPYKNYKPTELNPNNEKDYQMLMIQVYGFAAHELNLYLDVNPGDQNAIKLRNEYITLYKQALMQYENKYGALNTQSNTLDSTPWAWDTQNWPWEGNR